jgi:hypothetical protein
MNRRSEQTSYDFRVGDYLASPGNYKYGIVLEINHPYINILWEGHDVPYDCSPASGVVIERFRIPKSTLSVIHEKLAKYQGTSVTERIA